LPNTSKVEDRSVYDAEFEATRTRVDTFARTHPGFDRMGPDIERLLKVGFGLEQAFRLATILRLAREIEDKIKERGGGHAVRVRQSTKMGAHAGGNKSIGWRRQGR
jgi:hypothetical protein